MNQAYGKRIAGLASVFYLDVVLFALNCQLIKGLLKKRHFQEKILKSIFFFTLANDLLRNFKVNSEDGTGAVDLEHGVNLFDDFVEFFNRIDAEAEHEGATRLRRLDDARNSKL